MKCEGGRGQIDPPQKKTTLKMLCLISFKISEATWDEEYGFVSFAKSPSKSLRCKYGQNFLDTTKKSAGDALKIASKRVKI